MSAALTSLHGKLVHRRRVRVLAAHLLAWLPPGARVLDVGCGDGELGAALLADLPHHTDDPRAPMRECGRVARSAVLIKDHLADAPLARARWRLMDYVGNAAHRIALRYNYRTLAHWQAARARLGWQCKSWRGELGLHPRPRTGFSAAPCTSSRSACPRTRQKIRG